MQELFNFNYENKEYGLFYKHGFIFAKKVNGKLVFDLSKSDKELINMVLIQILPSKNIRNFGYIKFNNKQFKHLYDLENRYHIFFEGENAIPNSEDFTTLNFLYNNQEDFVALEEYIDKDLDEFRETKKVLKRKVVINNIKTTVKISIQCLLILALVFPETFLAETEKLIYTGQTLLSYNEIENNLTVEEIVNTINNNPNLSKDEKEYFTSFTNFFEDVLPYVNESDLLENLKKMKIVYGEKNEDIAGSWTPYGKNRQTIKIYDVSSFNETNLSVLRHEFFHVFSDSIALSNLSVDRPFYEFLNDVYELEYGNVNSILDDNFHYGYYYLYDYGYMMMELFDVETLRTYHANPNIKILINALMEIIPSEDKAYELFNLLNDYYISCKISPDDTNFEEYLNSRENLDDNIKGLIREYYEVKYEKIIDENIYMYYLYDNFSACRKIDCESLLDADNLHSYWWLFNRHDLYQYKRYFNNVENFSFRLVISNEPNGFLYPFEDYTIYDVKSSEKKLTLKG